GLVCSAHAEHCPDAARRDELADVLEQVLNAVVPIVPWLSSGSVAGHSEGHLPPEQRTTNGVGDHARPVEVLTIILVVPVPATALASTAGIHRRFVAARISIQGL